jgi:hypothetical protein
MQVPAAQREVVTRPPAAREEAAGSTPDVAGSPAERGSPKVELGAIEAAPLRQRRETLLA